MGRPTAPSTGSTLAEAEVKTMTAKEEQQRNPKPRPVHTGNFNYQVCNGGCADQPPHIQLLVPG